MKKVDGGRGVSTKKVVFIIGLALVYLGTAGFGGYFYWRYRQVMQNPAQYIDLKKYALSPDEENNQLLQEIGTLITLPKEETPIISTIKDVEKLKSDQFFIDAVNGDRLIIYQTAKQAILYRESERKIIKAGPVVLPDPAKPKVTIIADTDTAAKLEKQLTTSFATEVEIIGKTVPVVDHENLIVVDLGGSNAQLAQKIATALNGTVATAMPEGETQPASADIVIIAALLP